MRTSARWRTQARFDISKKDAKVCVWHAAAGRRKTVTTWSSMTSKILALRVHLIQERVTCVVMEATGDYWKPFYHLLEDISAWKRCWSTLDTSRPCPAARATLPTPRGCPSSVRRAWSGVRSCRPSRSASCGTDPDAHRDHRERGREVQRREKPLEDAGIKLSAVASDIMGVSGRAMLEALIPVNVILPGSLAALAKRGLRNKIPELTEALGRSVQRPPRPYRPGAPGSDRSTWRREPEPRRATTSQLKR